jgi:transcriptional regulator with XRE-family HTH domain
MRRGMSQTQLADQADVSRDYISKLENGARGPSMDTLMRIAEALQLPIAALTGEIPPPSRDPAAQHAVVRQIRHSLAVHEFLSILLDVGSGPVVSDSSLRRVRVQSARAWDLTHASDFTPLGALLSTLIIESEETARRAAPALSKAGFHVVAEVYQVVAALMAQLGETELSWIAADRAVFAAERADDVLLMAACSFRLGHAFLAGVHYDDAREAAGTALRALKPHLPEGNPQVISLWGALHLVTAIAAARRSQTGDADRALKAAEEAAALLGEDRNDFHTEFGPTNVQLHAVAVAVETQRPGEALRRAKDIDAKHLSPERQAHLLMDVARAHRQRQEIPQMVRALAAAEALAPDAVRYDWRVRDMVFRVMKRQPRPSRNLSALAKRLGVV